MPALKAAPRITIAEAVTECNKAVAALSEKAAGAKLYADECIKLAKTAKRLAPLLDDLSDNKPEAAAEEEGVKALKVRLPASLYASRIYCMQLKPRIACSQHSAPRHTTIASQSLHRCGCRL